MDAAIPSQATPARDRYRKWTLGRLLRGLPVKVLILFLLIIELYPLFWLITSSLKTNFEFLNNPFWSLPSTLNLQNYVDAVNIGGVATSIRNSLTVTIPSVFTILMLGSMAGFALEVMVWKGRHAVLLLIVGGIMVPLQMILLPLFTVYFKVGLTNSLWPLFLTYVGHSLPLTVFLMAAYFRAIPRELFEAATLDGANIFRAFWTVGLPMVKNGLFTCGLLMFFSIYNDLLISLTFNTRKELMTVQVGLLNFSGEYGQILYGPLFAAICLTVVGTLIVYIILNQQVMKGLAGGALKA
jgi:raffinose/stachyose/melibiose transport system permease protein